ncbi:hypothetical protein [Streptomyces yangpuensis]|uniref:hypothetical protein n=1 Tax=Streptomyces yangpuensis TaxID=1648182 RepID=UPI0036517609
MAITVSAIVLMACIVGVLIKTERLRPGPAIAAVLLGFFLASTGIAPAINSSLTSLASALGAINL